MIGYTHLMEFIPDRESTVSGLFMCIDGLVYVISPLIYQHLTNDIDFFIIFACAMNAVSLVMFAALRVPESLKFLLSKNRVEEFWHHYKTVQRFNRSSTDEN